MSGFYDNCENYIQPNKTFHVRNDIIFGDSILVVRGKNQIAGILYVSESSTINLTMDGKQTYRRYDMVSIFANNKLIIIERNSTNPKYKSVDEIRKGGTELEVYLSKVVLMEKYNNMSKIIKYYF